MLLKRIFAGTPTLLGACPMVVGKHAVLFGAHAGGALRRMARGGTGQVVDCGIEDDEPVI